MPSIPNFLQAKQLSVCSITPQLVGSGGVLTAQTSFSIKAQALFDTFTFSGTKDLFPVTNSDATINNYQTGIADFTATLGTVDKSGKVNSTIDLFFNGLDYVSIITQCTDLAGVPRGMLALYAIAGELTTGIVEQKNGTILTLRPCGIQPVWTPNT